MATTGSTELRDSSNASREIRGAKLLAEVRSALDRSGLTWPDFAQALGAHLEAGSLTRVEKLAVVSAAKAVFEADQVPSDLRTFEALAAQLAELLNVTFTRTAMTEVSPRSVQAWHRASSALAAILLACVAYLVFGNLFGGKSSLVKNPGIAVLVFVGLLLLLSAVEALHISVAVLRLTDLHDSRLRYPRTYKMHIIFRTEEGARKFLAGRQFLVITTVFAIAQLTTFVDANTWPGTHVLIPGIIRPILVTLFLHCNNY